MQIQLTEYKIIDKVSQAVDPLGLMRPAGALRDVLFPQFTVLTHHPAYLGLLCALWLRLEEQGKAAGKDLPREFRRLEILWGTAVSLEERPLNVTKFTRLLERLPKGIRLGEVSRSDSLLNRLSYGTLGHYSRPAMTWELVSAKKNALTELGRELAEGFAGRASDWNALLEAWTRNEPFDEPALKKIGRHFGLQAQASNKETKAWRRAIEEHCDRHPPRTPLWKRPLKARWLDFDDAPAYQAHWSQLQKQYPELRSTLDAIYQFERVTGALQLIFFHFLARAEREGMAAEAPAELKRLAKEVVPLAQACVKQAGFEDARRLVASVAQADATLPIVERCLIDHHMAHHAAKGAAPFIDHDGVKIRGRVDWGQISGVVNGLGDTTAEALNRAQYFYRRDWHFGKCRLWHDHAQISEVRS
ncbi:MAG: hypothetical protein ABI702_01810 [Burkholderiales bacterium]